MPNLETPLPPSMPPTETSNPSTELPQATTSDSYLPTEHTETPYPEETTDNLITTLPPSPVESTTGYNLFNFLRIENHIANIFLASILNKWYTTKRKPEGLFA